jgi:hypothetical protein
MERIRVVKHNIRLTNILSGKIVFDVEPPLHTLPPLVTIVFILSNFKDLFSRSFTTILSLQHYSVSPRVPHVTVTSQTLHPSFT